MRDLLRDVGYDVLTLILGAVSVLLHQIMKSRVSQGERLGLLEDTRQEHQTQILALQRELENVRALLDGAPYRTPARLPKADDDPAGR